MPFDYRVLDFDDLEEDEVDTSLLSILGAFLLHLNKRMKIRGTTIYFKLWFARWIKLKSLLLMMEVVWMHSNSIPKTKCFLAPISWCL